MPPRGTPTRTAAPEEPSQPTEEALVAQGQRRVNIIWEITQFIIAISVVEAALSVAVYLAVGGSGINGDTERQIAIVALFGLANLVIGFYFGRTNHQRTGGVGPTDAGR